MSSAFKIRVRVSREVVRSAEGVTHFSRDEFYAWLWQHYGDAGLQGIHEGTMLSDEAHAVGLETESFMVDAAQAPRERDWISGQAIEEADLYFGSMKEAAQALKDLSTGFSGVTVAPVPTEVPDEDWDREWKASFPGIRLPPFWHVLPPWRDASVDVKAGERLLRLNPGAGFGTGTHETTQLCLERLGLIAQTRGGTLKGMRVLDFGSGSGILAIGAVLLGAEVDACEIDPLANDNARGNADLNDIKSGLTIGEDFEQFEGPYDLVIANILRPVLVEFCSRLLARRKPGAAVLLSGLVDADVTEVSRAFSRGYEGRTPEVSASGDWRSLYWSGGSKT